MQIIEEKLRIKKMTRFQLKNVDITFPMQQSQIRAADGNFSTLEVKPEKHVPSFTIELVVPTAI